MDSTATQINALAADPANQGLSLLAAIMMDICGIERPGKRKTKQ